jgi:hypothetical protein
MLQERNKTTTKQNLITEQDKNSTTCEFTETHKRTRTQCRANSHCTQSRWRSHAHRRKTCEKHSKIKTTKFTKRQKIVRPNLYVFLLSKIGIIKNNRQRKIKSKKYIALDEWYIFEFCFQEMPLHHPNGKSQIVRQEMEYRQPNNDKNHQNTKTRKNTIPGGGDLRRRIHKEGLSERCDNLPDDHHRRR